MADTTADEAAIRALFDLQGEAWSRSDADRFASVFTPDADFINIVAKAMRGRAEIARHHKELWENVYRDATVRRGDLRIRFIRPDVATIEVESVLSLGEIERHAHMLAVAVRNDGSWQIQAVHNMVPFKPPAVEGST